ncbi:glyoxalase I/dioxygenase superfamily protein [Deinococcus aerius]|uniref:Glyoxalase I/dioxygenase superfamily protein n=1 Tax=Deinococcus aerius TaxID=200253 RepID=A0A2I9CXT9_9DEIO|nr:VOC family protein [Deinococcus aerius]GBF06919.1 glyoxalase I/dioxygenase superfamily protein [Deinococcus aerius]
MTAHLDHLVVAARTLEEGRAWLEGRLNVPAQPGGEHERFGTHNVLLSLGPAAYLEVIAVNPQAPAPERPRWFGLDTPEMRERLEDGPLLIHWVARVPDLDGLDLAPFGEPLDLARGENRWTLTVPGDGSLPGGGVRPSLIRWHTPSPPTRLPDAGVRLLTLRLGTPDPDGLRNVLNTLNLVGEVEVYEAPQPELVAMLETPEGPVTL